MAFTYEVDKDFDYTIEEKGNAYIALRKIKWGNSDIFKLDLRKYYASANGDTMNKGVSMTDEGAHELTRVLLQNNYGYPDEIIDTIKENRPDIFEALQNIDSDKSSNINEEYFDPRELIEDDE